MKANWREMPLGDLIQQRKDYIFLKDNNQYRRVRVRLHSKGIEPRDVILGDTVKTKKQYPIKAGDLLVAEIDAKVGGYGIVPSDLEGAVVSSHYYLYDINKSKLDIGFLGYWLKTASPLEQVQQFTRGALNYASIRPYHFPELKIFLPPLGKQRRIATKLDKVFTRVKEAKRLAGRIEEEQTALVLKKVVELAKDVPRAPMAEVAPVVRRKVAIDPDAWYPELGIRSFGNGTFHKDPIKGSELGSKRLYQIMPGDLLFSNVFSWEGAIAVVRPEDKGRYGSHRFITCVPDPELATAQYLCWWLLSDEGLADIRAASPGAAGRNKTLGIKKLEAIDVPLPPIEQQRELGELIRRVQRSRAIHQQTATSLEALMPSLLDQAFRGEL